MSVEKLGSSVFNYRDYTAWRFIHYFQQVRYVLKLQPRKILEIGPGDHTVTDFLSRKGIVVKTLDNDLELKPDYRGDIREKLNMDERFDLVLASEVFEHMDIKWLDRILENIKEVLLPGGHLIVSLPYSTLRLFPDRPNYGRIISCEGRLMTGIPHRFIDPFLEIFVGIYRILFQRCFRSAFRFNKFPTYPDNRFDVHHWDLGYYPTTRRHVRKIFERHFRVLEEKAHVNTNCVFYVLKKEEV